MTLRQTVPSTNNPGQGVRRTLFSQSLGRRPTPGANSTNSATSAATIHVVPEDTDDEIIVKDENGNYKLDQPFTTPLPRDEERDEREARNRLIETYKKHQDHVDPKEFMAILQASLKEKVDSLDQDHWMFEAEESNPQ